ncbi:MULTISPECIES: type II secretion system protein [unclassified Lebetimonas]|uniref:type II secretion system protein n=1 Tax=unclassified Lebetimonas TaxID=2648158 RepID=UPI0004678D9B|nr:MULTISPECIES: type II secretion system protein [unclassified Lebetimonas]
MKNQKNYKAFSLFEIVISIVVLGIIAATFPLILESVFKTAKTVTKEETVLNEMSLLTMILPYYFDENNTLGDNFYKDLNASNGESELLINFNSIYTGPARRGKAEFNNNIFRSGSSLGVSDIGTDSGENNISAYDDIDDFNNFSEMINGVNLTVRIYYIEDNASYNDQNLSFSYNYNNIANKTNIKLIKITSDNNVTIYYPTCNIGASKFLSLEEISR